MEAKVISSQGETAATGEAKRRAVAHDNAGEAVEVVGPVTGKEYRHMLSLRIDPTVARALRRIADERATSVSDLLREAALRLIAEHDAAAYLVRIERIDEGNVSLGSPRTDSSTGYGTRWADPRIRMSA